MFFDFINTRLLYILLKYKIELYLFKVIIYDLITNSRFIFKNVFENCLLLIVVAYLPTYKFSSKLSKVGLVYRWTDNIENYRITFLFVFCLNYTIIEGYLKNYLSHKNPLPDSFISIDNFLEKSF